MRLQSKFSEFAISLTIIIIHHDGYFFYGAGTTTMTDLLDAVTLFTQSESQFVTACATYQQRVAEYRRKT